MRIHVALALLVLSALSGCTSGDGDGDKEADLLASDEAAAPVLYLNLTVGDRTYAFTTGASGNGTGSGSASASATAANATGNSTSGGAGNGTAGNATGNATDAGSDGPAGLAPLNVTAQVGASGLPAGAVRWELDFGDGDGAADGNATGNSTGNSTDGGNGTAARRTGGSLPATEEHTYLEPGTYNVTLSVRVANGTAQTLVGALTVEEDTGATAFGPAPEPIVLEGTITGTFLTEDTNDETFELEAPVASMTLTMEYDTLTGEEDLDWVIVGPGGEEHEGAEAGQEEPVTFEAPTPGTWTITVIGYLALETGYTITVTFG